ncbi:MAG: hypothetical protein MJ252_05980 [archaeon]|nr:hypothetical protein [archaeon]
MEPPDKGTESESNLNIENNIQSILVNIFTEEDETNENEIIFNKEQPTENSPSINSLNSSFNTQNQQMNQNNSFTPLSPCYPSFKENRLDYSFQGLASNYAPNRNTTRTCTGSSESNSPGVNYFGKMKTFNGRDSNRYLTMDPRTNTNNFNRQRKTTNSMHIPCSNGYQIFYNENKDENEMKKIFNNSPVITSRPNIQSPLCYKNSNILSIPQMGYGYPMPASPRINNIIPMNTVNQMNQINQPNYYCPYKNPCLPPENNIPNNTYQNPNLNQQQMMMNARGYPRYSCFRRSLPQIPIMKINSQTNNLNIIRTSNQKRNTYDSNQKRSSLVNIPEVTQTEFDSYLMDLSFLLSKSDKIDHFIFKKMSGKIVEILKTHKGSKLFQTYLKNTQSEIINYILKEISPSLVDLMKHSYANYSCKKFFSYLNQKDRIEFLQQIKNGLISICKDSIGTYPIQGIIEQIGSKIEKKIILEIIEANLQELCLDPYGTHVVEKIIACFEDDLLKNIYDYSFKNFTFLSNNCNGIVVIKKILKMGFKKDLHDRCKKQIKDNIHNLIKQGYGNYIMQVINDHWEVNEVFDIISEVKGEFADLSKEKHSSNILEKCVEKNPKILSLYIEEIIKSNRLAELMKDSFGNYVIQKALKLSKGEEKENLMEQMKFNLCRLPNKKMISKWNSIIDNLKENKEEPMSPISKEKEENEEDIKKEESSEKSENENKEELNIMNNFSDSSSEEKSEKSEEENENEFNEVFYLNNDNEEDN